MAKKSNFLKVIMSAMLAALLVVPSFGTTVFAAFAIDNSTTNYAVNAVVGELVTLTVNVTAEGNENFTYEWYQNDIRIDGETSASYTFTPQETGPFYNFHVVVTDMSSNTSVTSEPFVVTVNNPTATFAITTHPSGATVNVSPTGTDLAVIATGESLTYQWYSNTTNSNSNGTLIDGAQSAVYTAPTTEAGSKYYYVVVTNNGAESLTSNTALVTVNAVQATPPVISQQPSDKTVNVNETATLSITATGDGTLTYQWYSNGISSNTGGTAIDGATSPAFNAPTSTTGIVYYYVEVSDGTNTVQSSIASVTVTNPLTITSQPSNKSVYVGGSANLTVQPSNLSATYQWYSNTTASNTGGTLISGATSNSYNAPTSKTGTTYYYAEISDGVSTIKSNVAAVSVMSEPVYITPPAPPPAPAPAPPPAPPILTVPPPAGLSLKIDGLDKINFVKKTVLYNAITEGYLTISDPNTTLTSPANYNEVVAAFSKILGVASKTDSVEEAAAKAAQAGLVSAVSAIPKREMTRVELSRMIGTALGIQPKTNVTAENFPFKDFEKIPAEDRGLVAALYEAGLFKGYADGTFGSDKPLTLDQVGRLIERVLGN